jgi:hypothetical protein
LRPAVKTKGSRRIITVPDAIQRKTGKICFPGLSTCQTRCMQRGVALRAETWNIPKYSMKIPWGVLLSTWGMSIYVKAEIMANHIQQPKLQRTIIMVYPDAHYYAVLPQLRYGHNECYQRGLWAIQKSQFSIWSDIPIIHYDLF